MRGRYSQYVIPSIFTSRTPVLEVRILGTVGASITSIFLSTSR